MLALRGLRHAWPGGPELRFPDAEVGQGGRLLVRGVSGAGKSTLLALLCGLLSPSAGEVLVAGEAVHRLGAERRDAWRGATLGFMPQRLHLSAALDVGDNLALPFVCAGLPVDRAAVRATVQRLGLEALLHRRPHQLSLGQAQRVALARALVRRPRLIVADEPSANLDDEACAQAMSLLDTLGREFDATLVVATHDARAVQALSAAADGATTLQLARPS